MTTRPSAGTAWQPTAALLRVSALPAALALLAVLARRVDLLYLAAPLALAALPLLRPPAGVPRARLEVFPELPAEGQQLGTVVRVEGADGAETAAVAVATGRWVRPPRGAALATVGGVRADGSATRSFDLRAERWGRHAVGPAVVTLSAAGGLLRWGPVTLLERPVRVLPLSAAHTGSTWVPRPRGAWGVHGSRRPGDAAELDGIRPYAPGDRMRRINWRVSLRSDELHVNATTSERDADVVVLLDGRFDAGTSGGVDGRASGIDVAVRATAALSAYYLGLSDRVGLISHGRRTVQLPARAGRAHLHRLLQSLLDVAAPASGGLEPLFPEPPGIDPRALVLLVSPLVGRQVFDRAVTLSRRGHAVLVVDSLPEDAGPATADAWTAPALRLWRLERDTRITQLRALGVPVVPWRGPGSLDQVLVDLTRAASRSAGLR